MIVNLGVVFSIYQQLSEKDNSTAYSTNYIIVTVRKWWSIWISNFTNDSMSEIIIQQNLELEFSYPIIAIFTIFFQIKESI